jgi:hypothetical protein
VRIGDDALVWDLQEGATGYNITKGYRYYDTVRGSASYQLTEPGDYRVVAFNDFGEYGSDYGTAAVYDGSDAESSVSYSYNNISLVVYSTCKNVGPGQSCVARCPTSYIPEGYNNPIYPNRMTGGACTTSDIVEADSWMGHRSYKCTVPTFSGEVVAMAMCFRN